MAFGYVFPAASTARLSLESPICSGRAPGAPSTSLRQRTPVSWRPSRVYSPLPARAAAPQRRAREMSYSSETGKRAFIARGSWFVARLARTRAIRATSYEPRATIYFSGPSPISAEDMDTGSAGRRLCREAHHSRWDDDSARQILATCRRAIPDGGKLLIAEMILPGLNEPGFAAASVPSRNTPRCWPQPASA